MQLLDKLNIKYRWLDHLAVISVADSVNIPGYNNPVKNLLIQEEGSGRKFLVVMAGDARMNQKLIREKFNTKRFKFADDDILRQTFNVASGSVSIFGLLNNGTNDVEIVIDQQILSKGLEIGFHPNDNTATVFFEPENLAKILEAMDASYTIMDLY